VSYDRDEWRRPWRADQLPGVTVTSAGQAPSPTDPQPAGDASDADARAAAGTTADTTEPGARSHQPPAPEPLTRFPQAPPAGFGAGAAGPGSPFGSVRPPDATGTVDPPEPKRRRGLVGITIGALFGAVLGTLATLGLVLPQQEPAADEPPSATPTDVSAPSIEVAGDGGTIVPGVAQAVTPSVVTIDVSGTSVGGQGGSLGSGVIYRSDGFILTNHHVIEPAMEGDVNVTVRLASGDIIDAEIVGSDELNDLAVLQVERTGLPAINLRPEDEPLVVGETVVAIGAPFGLETSVTAGIISALNREIRIDEQAGIGQVIPSVIQTDAAINPGNSGGALVDAQGRLIGINTAILSRSGASQGVGFAVSWEQAIESADQLIDQGFVRQPLLGVTGNDVTPEIAEDFGLPASRGAVIDSVQPGTGAADAGLRPGDIIVEFDGEPLATMSQLVAEVRRLAPDDTVDLVLIRDGERVEVEVTISERPRDE
jgi:S1-C subfamily serine protease